MGLRRSLAVTYCNLCPVQVAAEWIEAKGRHPHSDGKVACGTIAGRIRKRQKEIATDNGIDASRVPPIRYVPAAPLPYTLPVYTMSTFNAGGDGKAQYT